MSAVRNLLLRAESVLVQTVLRGLIRLFFRPQKRYISDKARMEAFSGPCVIVSNHVRGFDGGVILTMLWGKRITGLVAKDMGDNNRALAWFLKFLPTMPIDREHPSLSWLRDSRKLLKNGEMIYMCPEGKCNFDRVTQPFKTGCVLLAAMAGVPIVPVYHNGIYRILFGRRWRMMIGEPITVTPPPDGLNEEEMQREADTLYHRMQELEAALTGTVRTEETAAAERKRRR